MFAHAGGNTRVGLPPSEWKRWNNTGCKAAGFESDLSRKICHANSWCNISLLCACTQESLALVFSVRISQMSFTEIRQHLKGAREASVWISHEPLMLIHTEGKSFQTSWGYLHPHCMLFFFPKTTKRFQWRMSLWCVKCGVISRKEPKQAESGDSRKCCFVLIHIVKAKCLCTRDEGSTYWV